ncbi:MAG: hypothetical protein ACLSHO_09585 [Dysosmobacter sp.]
MVCGPRLAEIELIGGAFHLSSHHDERRHFMSRRRLLSAPQRARKHHCTRQAQELGAIALGHHSDVDQWAYGGRLRASCPSSRQISRRK